MKKLAMGAALVLTVVSWSAVAEDKTAVHSVMEQQCQAMGVQHGMTGNKMDDFMKKCLDVSEKAKKAMDMAEKHDMKNTVKMQAPDNGGKDMDGK